MIQLRRSITSTLSALAVPEIFNMTQVTSYPVKSRGTILGTSSYSSKGYHVLTRLIDSPKDLHEHYPSLGANILQEDAPYPLLVGCPVDGLPKLP